MNADSSNRRAPTPGRSTWVRRLVRWLAVLLVLLLAVVLFVAVAALTLHAAASPRPAGATPSERTL